MTNSEYYNLLVEEIISDLTANLRLKKFTSNSALIGAFAEESVNQLVSNLVSPFRVSTGSVFSKWSINKISDLPQIDCIIWNPSPLPALFEKGKFALVPYANSLGVIEIKSSNYSGVGKKIKGVLDREKEFVDIIPIYNAAGKSIKDSDPLSMGVICLFDKTKSDTTLNQLISDNKVCVFLEHEGDFKIKPSRNGILRLITFLGKIRNRGKNYEGRKSINIESIK
jgi:hypothetical protein